MLSEPFDHVPKTAPDHRRYDEEIERRKAMFRQARTTASALRTITDRQRGELSRADGHIMALMIQQNLRACVRREKHYRPTRRWLAEQSGYSERTASRSISRLKRAGIIVVSRYAQGGRVGHTGKGLATEFRTGCLQFVADQLVGLGFKLPKGLREDLTDLAAWAADRTSQAATSATDMPPTPVSTGTQCPGTLWISDSTPSGNSTDHETRKEYPDGRNSDTQRTGCLRGGDIAHGSYRGHFGHMGTTGSGGHSGSRHSRRDAGRGAGDHDSQGRARTGGATVRPSGDTSPSRSQLMLNILREMGPSGDVGACGYVTARNFTCASHPENPFPFPTCPAPEAPTNDLRHDAGKRS